MPIYGYGAAVVTAQTINAQTINIGNQGTGINFAGPPDPNSDDGSYSIGLNWAGNNGSSMMLGYSGNGGGGYIIVAPSYNTADASSTFTFAGFQGYAPAALSNAGNGFSFGGNVHYYGNVNSGDTINGSEVEFNIYMSGSGTADAVTIITPITAGGYPAQYPVYNGQVFTVATSPTLELTNINWSLSYVSDLPFATPPPSDIAPGTTHTWLCDYGSFTLIQLS